MRSVVVARDVQNPTLIPFDSLLYPDDPQAVLDGNSFAGQAVTSCAQYRSCTDLQHGKPLDQIAYYRWTLQKLNLQGPSYESFLYSEGKGCGVDPLSRAKIAHLPRDERYHVLALATAEAFQQLWISLAKGWDPTIPARDIEFFRLLGNNYTVYEGRHRIAILLFLSIANGFEAFETDTQLVRNDYYLWRAKSYLKRTMKQLLRKTS